MCEQVSAHVTEHVNVRFGRELKAWPRHLNATTTNTRPHSNNYNQLQSFYATARGQKVPIKSSSYQTTGQRHRVCYSNSSATPQVAHFLAVIIIARKLHCPLSC